MSLAALTAEPITAAGLFNNYSVEKLAGGRLDNFERLVDKFNSRHLLDRLLAHVDARVNIAADRDTVNVAPPGWTALNLHEKQRHFWASHKRFIVVPAGRRSGKTAIAKRKLVKAACRQSRYDDAWYIACAPTHGQAKRIYWRDLKALCPKEMVASISEGELLIRLKNGSDIQVMGMDVPERAEGRSLNGCLLDEYGNMKEHVWAAHLRPALADRHGFAWFIGAPEGRNHYYELFNSAGSDENWDAITWTTEEILPLYLGLAEAVSEILSAKADMDPLTYAQEYLASFVTFTGQAYYPFSRTVHASTRCRYDPTLDLVLAFDFNVAPGTATALQEKPRGTEVVGEVYIPQNSNTPAVCRKIIATYGKHEGNVYCYGDATGGSDGTAKVDGSDWELIKKHLRPVFGDRVRFRVPESNPRERARVNAVNTRLLTVDGKHHLFVDPTCVYTIKDFEGVRLLEGGSGEIDKDIDPKLTHLTDGVGYYIAKKYPLHTTMVGSTQA